ncbi:MAG: enoyl-CoA hydratase/isomerase family protein [Natrialbaceae archaeon]|nr:enoyl-CoA hydratase/isomerase family protein [Natrialbaceae archaeon]
MEDVGSGLAAIERSEHRADIYLRRPDKRNAMTVPMMADLIEAFERLGADDDVWAITLLGEGPVFSAGMDLEMMRERVEPDAEFEHDAFPDLLETIAETPQPVVVGIKRAAPAGAFELTLPCDFRIMGEDAIYGLFEVQLGTFPHGGGTQRLPRLIGLSKATEIVMTGEPIEAEEARTCGLVHEVCADDTVDDRSRALADELCSMPRWGCRAAKQALGVSLETPLEEGLALERKLGRELDDTADYREGFEARLEDREPEFVGE